MNNYSPFQARLMPESQASRATEIYQRLLRSYKQTSFMISIFMVKNIATCWNRVNAPKCGVLRSIKTRIANLISTYQLVTIMTILTETKIKYEIVLI